jgi:hypothetical protein
MREDFTQTEHGSHGRLGVSVHKCCSRILSTKRHTQSRHNEVT